MLRLPICVGTISRLSNPQVRAKFATLPVLVHRSTKALHSLSSFKRTQPRISVASRALTTATPPASTKQLQEDSTTTAVTTTDPAVPATNSDISSPVAPNPSGLFGKYSWYPFWTLSAAVIFSKELVIVNEEFLLGGLTGLVVFIAYVNFQELARNSLNAAVNKEREMHQDAYNIAADNMERRIIKEKLNETYPQDVKALVTAEHELATMSKNYATRKYENDLTIDLIKKLNLVKRIEKEESGSVASAKLARAIEFARQEFEKSPSQFKQEVMDLSIQSLPASLKQPAVLPDNHPVAKAFNSFMQQRHTPEQLGLKSFIPMLMEKDTKDFAERMKKRKEQSLSA